ncbi:MAG: sulfite exporter TauE/SafE family protein [Anaerolineales bacterium]|nr:sulfite exporter TauE/SafE family protein [Anaerolineales bacterium]
MPIYLQYLLGALAAVAAGMVNALAGGGTLISFPALTFLGVPAVAANITNTVALSPGYIGGALAQFDDLRGQKKRLWVLLPVSAACGVLGGYLLLQSGEKLFKDLVPYLILLACGLLLAQDFIRAWLTKRLAQGGATQLEKRTWIPVGLSAVYGGYFGAGASVIVLSALGLTLDDSLTRLNALKQMISFVVNLSAAVFFLFSGQIWWTMALVMALGAILGGVLGGKLAGRVKPSTLRWIVIVIGAVVATVYFLK